jgi:hypothetical protein
MASGLGNTYGSKKTRLELVIGFREDQQNNQYHVGHGALAKVGLGDRLQDDQRTFFPIW